MSPDDLIPVYDAPCKCGKGRIIVKKYPPAPEFLVEIFSHLVFEIECADCAKVFILKECDGAVCLLRRADISEREKGGAAYWQKAEEVENLANSIGFYGALANWLLSFESADAALRQLGHLSIVRYWGQNFRKAFGAKPDTTPMKELVKSCGRFPPLYELMKCWGKTFPELERLAEEWKQQKLSIVPIVEKLFPYESPLA